MQPQTKNPPFGGSWLPRNHGEFAVKPSPSFDAAPIACLPIAQFWEDGKAGVKVEGQRGFVLKQNHDGGEVGVNFDSFHGFPFDLGETQKPPCVALAGTFTLFVSQGISNQDTEVRAASVVTHGVARFRFRGSCDPWQGKSELPKKKRELPNKSGEMRGYWAKPILEMSIP